MTNGSDAKGVERTEVSPEYTREILHVIVGHGLRTYFLNAVHSVRMAAPDDEILVLDNASPDPQLRRELSALSDADPKMRLILRNSNDLVNGKVGGLYDAYRDAFAHAIREGFSYVHLVQGDMQVLWWDREVLLRAVEIFASNARCVNVFTCLLPADREANNELVHAGDGEPPTLRNYGLTDTGIYDLERWRQLDMSFADDEWVHAERYRAEGMVVICHPWPTDAQIPWPAVVRGGVQRGREVVKVRPFLLEPLSVAAVEQMKSRSWTWLEEVCVPWGWTCLTPMWTTNLSPDYLASRRREVSRRGLRNSLPRWERRGLDDKSSRWALLNQHRPSLWRLIVVVPAIEALERLRNRLRAAP
jgi:hypothetical protein